MAQSKLESSEGGPPVRPRWMARGVVCATAFALLLSGASPLTGQQSSLRGSSASLDVQNRQAAAHDFTYIRTPQQVTDFVEAGYLVPVRPNRDFTIHDVSYPYARPEAKLFVERLASQYRSACGERLVVTSLTRPQNRQPANASQRSVHPTGMAIDLRVSNLRACRAWLERTLLSLEGSGVIEATKERFPAHYHVVVFPQPYQRYVNQILARAEEESSQPSARTVTEYRVRRGDSLWTIARQHGVTVDELRAANDIRDSQSRIYAGQLLSLPAR